MKKIKLFCFPYAGGSSVIFNEWSNYLNNSIELCPIELSGRGKRYSEHLYDSLQEAVDDVFKIIENEIIKSRYAFFGHSLGSMIAYKLVQKINYHQYPVPFHVFFSGRNPPHIIKKDKPIYNLSNEEFKKEVFSLGGTPPEIIKNKELLSLLLPILKSDFKIAETYKYNNNGKKLNSDITIFYGKEDDTDLDDILHWKEYTAGNCKIYDFNDGHFFINTYRNEILKIINDKLI